MPWRRPAVVARPSAARAAASRVRPSSPRVQTSRTWAKAPLVIRRIPPFVATTTLTRLRTKSNGISATLRTRERSGTCACRIASSRGLRRPVSRAAFQAPRSRTTGDSRPGRIVAARELHDAFGEGARLVGAEHVHAAQVLDGAQVPHDHPVARHHPRPAGQVHAEDGGQQLRAQAHRERHREEQRLHRGPTPEHVGDEDHDHQDEHGDGQEGAEPTEPAVELGFRRLPAEAAGHGPELGGRPDRAPPGTARSRCARWCRGRRSSCGRGGAPRRAPPRAACPPGSSLP